MLTTSRLHEISAGALDAAYIQVGYETLNILLSFSVRVTNRLVDKIDLIY